MKSTMTRAVLIGAVLTAVAVQGCGRSETYGEAVTETNKTAISDILLQADRYEGETVRLEGKIATECPSGCWFELRDNGAVIYVDMAPAGFAIPQHVGRDVVVEGTVVVQDGKPKIHARGVEIH
jgi:hypothetical protein